MAKQPFENIVKHLFQIVARSEFKPLSDAQLLQRYVDNKDELAFGELVRRNEAMVWNACWRVLGQHQDTEDAFQATFMTLFRQAAKIRSYASIEGWLHHVACKLAHHSKRTRIRRHVREERKTMMGQESYEEDNFQRECGEVLDKELTCMPEKYRNPLILCYLKGLPRSEASHQLGISLDSLEWRLEEGRRRLKKRLSKYGTEWSPTMLMEHVSAVPQGLTEKTLDMVRIMTLSNGAMESAVISPQIAILVKEAMGMTLKMKLLLGSVLLSLMVVGAGAAKYTGVLHMLLREQQEAAKRTPEELKPAKISPLADLYGDSLPSGALARLGTVRFRDCQNNRNNREREIVFTPDSQAVGVISSDEVPHLWDMKTGAPVRQFKDGLRGSRHAGTWLSLDGRRLVCKHKLAGNNNKVVEYRVQEADTGKLIRTFEVKDIETKACCALSPDGKTLVASFRDCLCLLDIATGKKIWEQKLAWQDVPRLRSLTISPDGTKIAVGYDRSDPAKVNQGSIELRDARTGKTLGALGHPWKLDEESGNVLFSPDGQILMVVYAEIIEKQDPSVYLWDVTTGKERWHLNQQKHAYKHPVFSPDGKMLAVRDFWMGFREIGFYEVATGTKKGSCQQYEWKMSEIFENHLTFSPDGKVLATIEGSLIRCWDVATGKVLASPPLGHESAVSSVAFARDGRTLLSGGSNETVYLWDSITGRKRRTLGERGSLWPARTISLFMQGGVRSSADGKIIVDARYEVPRLDERQIASMSSEDALETLWESAHIIIYIWDAATGHEIRRIQLPSSKQPPSLHSLALSPDGKFLAVWLTQGEISFVSLREVSTGKQIAKRIFGGHPIFSDDSRLVMTQRKSLNLTDTFNVWEAATGKEVSKVDTGVIFEAWPKFATTLDWRALVGVVRVNNQHAFSKAKYSWCLNSLEINRQSKINLRRPRYLKMALQNPPEHLAISPDGKMMAWPHRNGVIHVLETATGIELTSFQGHNGDISSLCFSPDSSRLASGSADTTILIWDVTGGYLDVKGDLRIARLSDKQVQQLWDDLAASDGARAHRAIWALTAASKQTVPFLRKHLSPVTNDQASSQRIARLIKELDSETYAIRQKAATELAKLGEAAEDDMRQALEKRPSAEVRKNLERLLGAIEKDQAMPSGDSLRGMRATEILERIGTPDARRLLQILSQGVAGARQTREARASLERLQHTAKQQ